MKYSCFLSCSKITNRQASSNLKYAVSSRLAIQASSIHAPYSDAPLPGKDMNDKVVLTLNKSCTVESVKGFLSELTMKPHTIRAPL